MRKIIDFLMLKVVCKLLGFTINFKDDILNITVKSEYGRKNLKKVLEKLSEKLKEE